MEKQNKKLPVMDTPVTEKNFAELLEQLFKLPNNKKPICLIAEDGKWKNFEDSRIGQQKIAEVFNKQGKLQ